MYVIGLSTGETVWTSVKNTWSGRRNLIESEKNFSMTFDGTDARDSLQLQEALQATMPSWCSFAGMT